MDPEAGWEVKGPRDQVLPQLREDDVAHPKDSREAMGRPEVHRESHAYPA